MNKSNGGQSGVSSYIATLGSVYSRFRVHFTRCMTLLYVVAQSFFIPECVYANASSRNNYPIRLTKYPPLLASKIFNIIETRIQKAHISLNGFIHLYGCVYFLILNIAKDLSSLCM